MHFVFLLNLYIFNTKWLCCYETCCIFDENVRWEMGACSIRMVICALLMKTSMSLIDEKRRTFAEKMYIWIHKRSIFSRNIIIHDLIEKSLFDNER